MPYISSHQYKKINRSLALESPPNQSEKKCFSNFENMFSGYFSFVAATLTLTPSATATRMSSHRSEILAAATIYNPGSRTSEHGKHTKTSVISSSGINTDTGIPISGITPRREETKLFEVETIMAPSTSSSSSVSAANHKELNSENSLDTENALNSVNGVSLIDKQERTKRVILILHIINIF